MSASFAVGSGVGKDNEEVTLVDIARRLSAIEEIVQPMQLVPNAVATLEGTVRDQGQQQAALNIALTRVERQLQDLGRGFQGRHRAVADDEDDPGDDFIPTAHKLEFLKFDGTRALYHS
jgi:hypothetical protein